MSVTISELEVFLDFVRQEVQAGWNQFSLPFFARIWDAKSGQCAASRFFSESSFPSEGRQTTRLSE